MTTEPRSPEGITKEYIEAVVGEYRNTYRQVQAGELSVVDDRSGSEEILANPDSGCPEEVLAVQRAIELVYLGFDGELHIGRMEVHKDAVEDVEVLFAFLLNSKFPVEKVIPASEQRWDDSVLMAGNYSSGFNFRRIAEKPTLSSHALGLAVDINTRDMPYVYTKQNGEIKTDPEDAVYNPENPKALTSDHEAVKVMEHLGWEWGGNWTLEEHGMIDYQHFEKKLVPPLTNGHIKALGLTGLRGVGMLNPVAP